MRLSVLSSAVALCALAHVAPARAELDEAGREIQLALIQFQSAVQDAQAQGTVIAHYFDKSVDDCLAVVAAGQKLGIAPTQVMDGIPESYLFKRAAQKCEEYGAWKKVIEAGVAVADAKTRFGIAQTMKPGDVSGDWAKEYGAVGAKCLVDLDRMAKAGLNMDLKLPVGSDDPESMSEVRTKYCQGLVDWAKQFAVATEAARAEAEAALRAKYTKYGIGGDRLKLLMDLDNIYIFGRGCSSYLEDMTAKKKTPVIIYFNEMADGGTAIYRYDLRGDKIVKHSYHEVTLRESAYKFCK